MIFLFQNLLLVLLEFLQLNYRFVNKPVGKGKKIIDGVDTIDISISSGIEVYGYECYESPYSQDDKSNGIEQYFDD